MFDPYSRWLRLPPGQRSITHYQLLGISPEEQNAQVIEEAALRLAARIRSYQLRYPQESTRLLTEISQALDTLLDSCKRQGYDAALGLSPATATAQPPATAGGRPRRWQQEKRFGLGGVYAMVLGAEVEAECGKKKVYKVRLRRCYRRGGDWYASQSLRLAHLPAALAVLQVAWRYVQEQDANALRSGCSGTPQ
jgi:hypothetical protein